MDWRIFYYISFVKQNMSGNFRKCQSETRVVNFENIKTYSTDFPKAWSFLWSPEEANKIPLEHKDQIFFLNSEACGFAENYINSSKMITGPLWKPFNEKYFTTIEEFDVTENCDHECAILKRHTTTNETV